MHIVHFPGERGELSLEPEFYGKLIQDMRAKDFLFIQNARIPLRILDSSLLGLKDIDMASMGMTETNFE